MRTRFITLTAVTALAATAFAAPVIPRDEAIEQKVEATLSKMTLDEKIGQMTELAIDLIAHRGPDGKLVYHPGMLDSIIGKYKVGSILNSLRVSQRPSASASTSTILLRSTPTSQPGAATQALTICL